MSTQSVKRALYEGWKKVYNVFSGHVTSSSFQDTGTLTAKEFVEAGDALCQKIPVWEWCSGDPSIQPFLPPTKKYLVFRGATSFQRAETDVDLTAGEGTDVGDGWIATHPGYKANTEAVRGDTREEKEINWDDEDDACVTKDDAPKNLKGCRLYDVYVVYDKYYQTPRVFLVGFEDSKPLTKEQMMEDVYADNREKTVSIDSHPFLSAPCISIHPCKHAETMKVIIGHHRDRYIDDAEGEEGKKDEQFVFPTHMALFIFLKFISSVIPTINYDMSVDMDL
eukprot:Tbor_TRINITY_DN3943_c0_g1::TRINITY_DN3943_c0_g1_i1::g.785::m.785/K08343/ATG3; ubiquitin-like-conjugating enzyme ATG3